MLIEASVEDPHVIRGAFNATFFVAARDSVEVESLIFSRLQLKKMAMANTIATAANFTDFMIYCFG
jgi:hypothetical protein